MRTPTSTAVDAPTTRDASRADSRARIAPRAIGHALLAGIAADMLLRDGPIGLGFPLWIAIAATALISLSWRAQRDVPSECAAWLLVAFVSACGLAWRDSGMLQFLDLIATAGALGMAAIALGNRRAGLLAERFRDTIWAGVASIRVIAWGIVPNVGEAIHDAKGHAAWESQSRRTIRSAVLAVGVLVVFGSLLRSADPIFASLVELPDFKLDIALSHVLVAGWFAWLLCGWANAALGSTVASARAPQRLPLTLSVQDLSASLGVLNVLFAAFMVAQLGWLFGGESFLRARTGLTAAEYARHGFFEMVWVVALVVPLLVFTRAALIPSREAARRHTALSLPLLVLLGGIIVSAAGRMQLYVHFYGLTVDRFYPLVFMAWLIVVLGWLALTVLRDRGRSFVAGTAVSAFAVLIALNAAAPDAIVAHFNENRAHQGAEPLGADVRHMSELSGEAVETALRLTLAPPRAPAGSRARSEEDGARCDAARNLLNRWGPSSSAAERGDADAAWRTWNIGEQRAVRAVGARTVALLKLRYNACKNVSRAERVIDTP
ncbi:MAG: DUF4173 domain-containing protein [Gemmatimonadota bacterium]|nr:DUF4173 domain-containing protein [Gemmatimonadota bacterium]